jgi:hypothetical protein
MLSFVDDPFRGVTRVEDVTPEQLGGATPMELAAFRMAALQQVLHLECPERTAVLLVYGDGDWRERVEELVPLQWGLSHGTIARQPGLGPVDRRAGEGDTPPLAPPAR